MEPTIIEWKLQWYLKVPVVLNVCVNLSPLFKVPLEKLLSSAVTVWAILSVFVQVIVVPDFTVRVTGLKLILAIVTEFGLVLLELLVELLLHERPIILKNAKVKTEDKMIFMDLCFLFNTGNRNKGCLKFYGRLIWSIVFRNNHSLQVNSFINFLHS